MPKCRWCAAEVKSRFDLAAELRMILQDDLACISSKITIHELHVLVARLKEFKEAADNARG